MCSKAGRASSPLDTPNGETMFSLRSNELGGSPLGKAFDLGATRDQLDPCTPRGTASRIPKPTLATITVFAFLGYLFARKNLPFSEVDLLSWRLHYFECVGVGDRRGTLEA